MKVDIIFLAYNRREYTEESLRQLERNTNWNLVESLKLIDDTSSDGTTELLRNNLCFSVPTNFRRTQHGNPVGIMNWYLSGRRHPAGPIPSAPWFAKIDNDTIVPPGWLDACIAIAETDNTDLIGIESRYCQFPPMVVTPGPDPYPVVKYRPTDHVGGIGLFRREVFDRYPLPKPNNTYYGFTEWQWQHPDVRKCWIDPPLPVFLLDHLPMEPWKSLGEEYERNGWQRRQWGYYDEVEDRKLWEWWNPLAS